MSDNLDIATEREELARAAAMTQRKPEGPRTSSGKCLYCSCVVLPGFRWCDASCRDDWQAEQGK